MGEVVGIEFDSPGGETLRFEWDTEALERLGPSAAEPPWKLSGELDWDEVDAVRVFSGRLEEGTLAIAAVRPAGASGHGKEAIAGILVGDEGVERLDEVLLSTEVDADGNVRRVGLELYPSEGAMPLRIAGDRTGSHTADSGGITRATTALELRAAGTVGRGQLEILRRA